MQTNYFKQAIGVFEGGGVRGAAFAGAYRSATKSGIRFLGTLGTSAGSIAAVLIAANFTPKQVLEAMEKPFRELLMEADAPLKGKTKQWMIGKLGETPRNASKVYFSQGLYSSRGIENWIQTLLATHLKIEGRLVTFSDLPNPCAIVATNLRSSKYKIWSTLETPADPVGFAVRSSCTIPFFFQPTDRNGEIFVDGGLLSNLPLFLAPHLQLDMEVPILCFRLIQDEPHVYESPKNGIELAKRLVPALLNGVTEIQLSMDSKKQVIDIRTGTISSTDFDITKKQIDDLVLAGSQAIEEFVMDEQARILLSTARTMPAKGLREALLDETSKMIGNANHTVDILAGDLSWLREIGMSILLATKRGVKVRIVSEGNKGQDYRDAVKAARAWGAHVFQVKKDQNVIKGTAIDLQTAEGELIAIEEKPSIHGKSYRLPHDSAFIQLFRNTVNAHIVSSKVNFKTPKLKPLELNTIETCLRKISIYKNLKITIQTISPAKLKPLSRYLEVYKISRALDTEKILLQTGLSNGAIIEGSPWPITPPVVELLKNGDYIIIDGTHRVYNAYKNGHDISAVVIDNPVTQLPAIPQKLDNLQIRLTRVEREERYERYDPKFFRDIKGCFYDI